MLQVHNYLATIQRDKQWQNHVLSSAHDIEQMGMSLTKGTNVEVNVLNEQISPLSLAEEQLLSSASMIKMTKSILSGLTHVFALCPRHELFSQSSFRFSSTSGPHFSRRTLSSHN